MVLGEVSFEVLDSCAKDVCVVRVVESLVKFL